MQTDDDALSAVLQMVRLKACVYFMRDLLGPWGMEIPRQPHGPFHMVLRGTCLLEHGGTRLRLTAGDVVLFPDGAPHALRDREQTPLRPAAEVFPHLVSAPAAAAGNAAGNGGRNGGGNGAGNGAEAGATRMLCGHFERDRRFDHPMFRELPPMLVVRNVFDPGHAPLLGTAVTLLTQEGGTTRPGASVVADRMGEVLFVEALRAWMAGQRPGRGFLAAVTDPRLARALTHIHGNAGREIDLGGLARVAGMSRTAFALHFSDVMGTTPAAYLTRWRMLQALEMLTLSRLPVAEIAERVGYSSDAGFIRAFKRAYGENPGALRRSLASGGEDTARAAG